MRLLNTATLKLEGPFMGYLPSYSILSHTWGDDELSLQEFISFEANTQSKGFQKIQSASAQAAQDGHKYIWVDTVCIDKTSSSELSEAINSMYNWYRRAVACYVYLEDYDQDLAECRWFSRGWTLQELIAPRAITTTFFDGNWKSIGTKTSLLAQICEATLIDEACLTKVRSIWTFGVAERMSWASKRKTTRPEDIAYCLLGLFGVNMPLLYGEGAARAFLRLQHEILQVSNDQTIFAWSKPEQNPGSLRVVGGVCGALALSPAWFESSARYRPTRSWNDESWIATTKRGVTFRARARMQQNGRGAVLLKCQLAGSFQSLGFNIIPLRIGVNEYIRRSSSLHCVQPKHLEMYSEEVTITLRIDMLDMEDFTYENPVNYLAVVRLPCDESGYCHPPERPRNPLNTSGNIVRISPVAWDYSLEGDILSFRAAKSSTTSFIVALFCDWRKRTDKASLSISGITNSTGDAGVDYFGVYSNLDPNRGINSVSLTINIKNHLCFNTSLGEFTKVIPATRSVRDGLDVWTLAGGELVHVAVTRNINPGLGYMGCARILAGTCWETHIKALADWGPMSPAVFDPPPSISAEQEMEM
ncbi:heterokaryon incompatibility protein-domain-containing protein [Podospora conica]|nr:heterokaryon incompatibility protein-domain-containing protein [Schizothecium conicum]